MKHVPEIIRSEKAKLLPVYRKYAPSSTFTLHRAVKTEMKIRRLLILTALRELICLIRVEVIRILQPLLSASA